MLLVSGSVSNKDRDLMGSLLFHDRHLGVPSVIIGTSRLIGRKFQDSPVQADMKHWPFKALFCRYRHRNRKLLGDVLSIIFSFQKLRFQTSNLDFIRMALIQFFLWYQDGSTLLRHTVVM